MWLMIVGWFFEDLQSTKGPLVEPQVSFDSGRRLQSLESGEKKSILSRGVSSKRCTCRATSM